MRLQFHDPPGGPRRVYGTVGGYRHTVLCSGANDTPSDGECTLERSLGEQAERSGRRWWRASYRV